MISRATGHSAYSHIRHGVSAFVLTATLFAPGGCEQLTLTKATQERADDRVAAAPRRLHEYRYPAQPPVLDAEAFRTFISRFEHRVVVIHFWASWSESSVRELAQLADWVESSGNQQIQVVACSLDEPQAWQDGVLPALAAARANFPCIVLPRSQKATIRGWLGADWSYDLPARCVIDARGNVARFAASSEPLTIILAETRDLAAAGGYASHQATLPPRASALRAKLIDVRRGEAVSLPEVTSDAADVDALAKAAAEHIAKEVDRRLNARIAVLGFPNSKYRTSPCAYGNEVAESMLVQLRSDGYFDLMGPSATAKMLGKIDVSALAAEYDPSIVKGRLSCDYLIIGCVRGNVVREGPPPGQLAGSDAEGNPSGDPVYTPSSDEPIN